VQITDFYTKQTITRTLRPGEGMTEHWQLQEFFGWYDLTVEVNSDSSFERRFAGHVENGKDSVTDPAIGTLTAQQELAGVNG